MAWVKIPAANHAVFRTAMQAMPRAIIIPMFGGLAALVNGNLACALFGRSVIVRLDAAGCDEVLAMDGGGPFDPMGHGPSKDVVMLPELMLDELGELRAWMRRSLEHAATLPPKKKPKKKRAKRA